MPRLPPLKRGSARGEHQDEKPRWCGQRFGRRLQDRAQDGGGDPKGERGPKTPPSRENHQRPQDGARTELSRWSPRKLGATDGQSGPEEAGWQGASSKRASEGRRPAQEGWEGGRKENISRSQTWLLEPENGHERSGPYRSCKTDRVLNEFEMRPE